MLTKTRNAASYYGSTSITVTSSGDDDSIITYGSSNDLSTSPHTKTREDPFPTSSQYSSRGSFRYPYRSNNPFDKRYNPKRYERKDSTKLSDREIANNSANVIGARYRRYKKSMNTTPDFYYKQARNAGFNVDAPANRQKTGMYWHGITLGNVKVNEKGEYLHQKLGAEDIGALRAATRKTLGDNKSSWEQIIKQQEDELARYKSNSRA